MTSYIEKQTAAVRRMGMTLNGCGQLAKVAADTGSVQLLEVEFSFNSGDTNIISVIKGMRSVDASISLRDGVAVARDGVVLWGYFSDHKAVLDYMMNVNAAIREQHNKYNDLFAPGHGYEYRESPASIQIFSIDIVEKSY